MKHAYKLEQQGIVSPIVAEQRSLQKEIEHAEAEGNMGKAAYLRNKLKKSEKAARKLGE